MCVWLVTFIHSIIISGRDDVTDDHHVRTMLEDIIMRIHKSNPVQGTWCLNATGRPTDLLLRMHAGCIQ